METSDFTEHYQGSIEEDKLLKIPLGQTNYKSLTRLKKSDLKEKNNSKQTKGQIQGYEFEWEIWKFFHDLKPFYMSDPNHDFLFDLSEYSSKVSKSAKSALNKLTGDESDTELLKIVSSPQPTRETDVVAIYERHIFIIECKHTSKNNGSKELERRLRDFLIFKPFIEERCEKIFGMPFNAVFIAASSGFNIDNTQASTYLKDQSIILFDGKRREYIKEVINESQSAEFALIQFLGFFRSGHADFNEVEVVNKGKQTKDKKINEIQYKKEPWKISSFTSESGKGKKNKVYTFSVHPEDMLKISTVAHQQFNNIFEAESIDANYYQRILTSARLEKIKQHLELNKTPFANNVLVSYRGTEEGLEFTPIKITGAKGMKGNKPGILKFNACPGTFHVIDGQHRLFGYTAIEKKIGGMRESHRIIVTAFQGLTVEEEAEIFLEVNSNAKPIVPSLLMEIEWSSQASTLSNLCNGIIFEFRGDQKSPLYRIINDAQKNAKNKLAPKNLKSSIISFESFGGKAIDKWYKSQCAKNQLPDSDIIIFWSSSFNETLENYYKHFVRMVHIFYKYNKDRWKTEKGVVRNIFFGGLLQAIDRITISAIEDWRKKNPDIVLKSLFLINMTESQKAANYGVRQSFIKEVTDLSLKKMKALAKNFAAVPDEEKDKILGKDYFNLGAGAISLVTTFLVKEYLSNFNDLVRPKDKENYDRISNTLSAKQVISLKAKLKKYEKETANHIKNQPKSVVEDDRKERAGKHYDQLKNISYSILTRTIGNGFWKGLIMGHFYEKYEEPRVVGGELHSGNAWFNVFEKHTEHTIEYGEKAFKEEWSFVEGAVVNLIANPRKIIRADNYSWENRIRLLQYIWEIMLIPKKGSPQIEDHDWEKIAEDKIENQDKSIWNEKDPENQKEIVKILNSPHWKDSIDYIRIFGKVRHFERHGDLDAEENKPWELHDNDFDYYEPLYIEKLEEIKEVSDKLQENAEAETSSEEDEI